MSTTEKEKEFTIIINAREKSWENKKISYEQIIELAFGSYSEDENITYTVLFSKGENSHHEGSLIKGKSVVVKDGIVFTVTLTNKS
jgi:hypothetical protein